MSLTIDTRLSTTLELPLMRTWRLSVLTGSSHAKNLIIDIAATKFSSVSKSTLTTEPDLLT